MRERESNLIEIESNNLNYTIISNFCFLILTIYLLHVNVPFVANSSMPWIKKK